MAVRSKTVPYLLRTRERWGDGYAERAEPGDWRPTVDEMSNVQKMVHLTARWVDDDRDERARRLFDEGRETYRQTLQDELNRWGCGGRQALAPAVGAELSAIRERVDWAAESVKNTYNLELAKEIVRVGEETPTANRHVYAHRLYYREDSWDGRYWQERDLMIAQTETMAMVNAALADFYARNGDLLQPEANVLPIAAVCPICQEMVDGNPWRSVDAVYNKFDFPPHPNCPHRPVPAVAGRLANDQCALLWAGE
ncbi:MAG: hypothetical protein ACYSVY_00090 [Planctomycetota bacterium]|jgi:hypothetical protein